MSVDLFQRLSAAFDAERCRLHVNEIYSRDRWFDFAHFRQSAAYCAGQFRQMGLDQVEMLELAADGRTRYGDWVVPQAWEADGATLRFAGDRECEPPLADYRSDPCSLMMFSAPTPPGGVKAEVAVADDPSEVPAGSLRGKLVLTRAKPGSLVSLAVAEGALGILSDHYPLYPGVRDSSDAMRGHSRWENDLVYPVNGTGLFGFSLSPENGARLRDAAAKALAAGGSVQLRANVGTRLADGVNHTVSALIPGTDAGGREVIFCAHLYEPGANDNASGCGALLELAAAVQAMIREGVIARPRFGLRFIMGYECAGLMGYVSGHGDAARRSVAAINMDMVGAACADRAVLHVWHNPLSNWSCLDTLLPALAKEYRLFSGEPFPFAEAQFSVGDNLLADPSIGVPTVSMIMHPALSYHSSMDGMEKVDPAVLKRNAVIAGAAALTVALPDTDRLERLPGEMELHKQAMTAGASGLCKAMLETAFRDARIKLAMDFARDLSTAPSDESRRCQDLLRQSAGMYPFAGSERIPVRLVQGTLTLEGLEGLPREALEWHPFYDYRLNCPLFWADGRHSLAEIAALSAAELGVTDTAAYGDELTAYFGYLEQLGYIRYK